MNEFSPGRARRALHPAIRRGLAPIFLLCSNRGGTLYETVMNQYYNEVQPYQTLVPAMYSR